MHFYLVAVSHRSHSESVFAYHSEISLPLGSVVMVELGKKSVSGVVIKKIQKPAFKTKQIQKVINEKPLPLPLINLAKWLEQYYGAPASNVWQTILPRGVSKKRRIATFETPAIDRKKHNFTLNKEQEEIINFTLKNPKKTILLQGVTGSGKTAIYIELAKKTINTENRSVIVLVPEIALTSQLVGEFKQHFKDILITHSSMTEAERHVVWQKALTTNKPQLVIGPRSALFLPLENIGLIVVDEAHETSFKQEQTPRYSALRAARVLANEHKATLLLGSATPSITDRYLAEKAGSLQKLTKTAKKTGKVETILIDSKKRADFSKHRFISNQLINSIEETLKNKQQVLLFHNRRGWASVTLCENCGWSATCDHCFVPMVLHADINKLICHVCGQKQSIPTSCPECSHTNIVHKGLGTKTIEDAVSKLFPSARIARFDADSDASSTLEKLYQEIYSGKIDIIIGTQVVAKGLDLPNLALVGIVQADGGLILPDFAAEERVFQLLLQVMGRVGRDEKLSKIIVQTYQPDSMPIAAALSGNYDDFYKYTLAKRMHDNFPPFTHLLKLTCTYKTESGASVAARNLKQKLTKEFAGMVEVLGPSPAFYERAGNMYRWQIIVKSKTRETLLDIVKQMPPNKWQTELDPVSLL